MINHARTLLLNSNTDYYSRNQYIPKYTHKKLPEDLQQIWNIFFSSNPSDLAKNHRVKQLLIIIHSTKLVDYVYKLDKRITYLPFYNEGFIDEPEGLPELNTVLTTLENVLQNNTLFKSNQEDIKLFEKYWNDHKLYSVRLSAVLLALIYRIENLNAMERC